MRGRMPSLPVPPCVWCASATDGHRWCTGCTAIENPQPHQKPHPAQSRKAETSAATSFPNPVLPYITCIASGIPRSDGMTWGVEAGWLCFLQQENLRIYCITDTRAEPHALNSHRGRGASEVAPRSMFSVRLQSCRSDLRHTQPHLNQSLQTSFPGGFNSMSTARGGGGSFHPYWTYRREVAALGLFFSFSSRLWSSRLSFSAGSSGWAAASFHESETWWLLSFLRYKHHSDSSNTLWAVTLGPRPACIVWRWRRHGGHLGTRDNSHSLLTTPSGSET